MKKPPQFRELMGVKFVRWWVGLFVKSWCQIYKVVRRSSEDDHDGGDSFAVQQILAVVYDAISNNDRRSSWQWWTVLLATMVVNVYYGGPMVVNSLKVSSRKCFFEKVLVHERRF